MKHDISIEDFESFVVEQMRPPQKRCSRERFKTVCYGQYTDSLCRACAIRARDALKEKNNA
jgi:hypothetical protein